MKLLRENSRLRYNYLVLALSLSKGMKAMFSNNKEIETYVDFATHQLDNTTMNHIKYTLIHKDAINQLTGKFSDILGGKTFDNHDRDKLVYLTLFNDTKYASKIHKSTAKHHFYPEAQEIKYEMILDYESAHMSKADKPLSAYDTILTYYPERMTALTEPLKQLGLWEKSSPYVVNEEEMYGMFDKLSESRILEEIEKSIQFFISDEFIDYINI